MRSLGGNAGCLFPDTARCDDEKKTPRPPCREDGEIDGTQPFRLLPAFLSVIADQLVVETFLVEVERMNVHAAERGKTV